MNGRKCLVLNLKGISSIFKSLNIFYTYKYSLTLKIYTLLWRKKQCLLLSQLRRGHDRHQRSREGSEGSEYHGLTEFGERKISE